MERLYTGDQEAFFAEAQVTSHLDNLTRNLVNTFAGGLPIRREDGGQK